MSNRNRSGQAAIFVVLAVPLFFGLAGLVFDMGMAYAAQLSLSNSTQAAALAGAEAMALPGATLSSVTTAVKNLSSASGGANAGQLFSGAAIASGYPVLSCLSTVSTTMSVSCYGPSSANAIAVKQTASVPTYFLRMFGASSFNLSATATAAMRGATSAPYNVAIVVDTTRSMTDRDSDSNCSSTRISCALSGIQVLLGTLSPCNPGLGSCGTVTSGNVPKSVDRVSLFVFPPVTTGTVANDYNCGGSVSTAAYTNPLPSTSTYQVVGFSSDYRSSDNASSLSTSSNLIAAVAGTSGTPCLQVIGGYGTYYAQAINNAQAALVSEKSSFPGSQNVMIILSDGDATASAAAMPGSSLISGTYTSSIQECHQAVTAAQAAAAAGTRVYTVAYGAEAVGCTTDLLPPITPCQTMEQMASSSTYFYSDYTATGGTSSCISGSQPTTNLNQIFKSIAEDLTVSRLIPNNTQ